jgi:hypothetical protein
MFLHRMKEEKLTGYIGIPFASEFEIIGYGRNRDANNR